MYAFAPGQTQCLVYENFYLSINLTFYECVDFYKTESGGKPVESFLDMPDSKAARKVTWVLALIEERQGNVPANHFEKLKHTADIWEVKAKSGSNEYSTGFIDEETLVRFTD